MLTSKSVDLINILVLEIFSLFSRVALKKNVPPPKETKEPPIWKAPLSLIATIVKDITSQSAFWIGNHFQEDSDSKVKFF